MQKKMTRKRFYNAPHSYRDHHCEDEPQKARLRLSGIYSAVEEEDGEFYRGRCGDVDYLHVVYDFVRGLMFDG